MGLIHRKKFSLPDLIPTQMEAEGFWFEVLQPIHAELDFHAIMRSKEFLRRWSNSSWPVDEFTLEDNLQDLNWHYDEFTEATAFTYTIIDHDKNQCLGCFYIRDITSIQSMSPDEILKLVPFQFFVSYWVIPDIRNTPLENTIFTNLLKWLKRDWNFPSVLFASNRQIPEQNKIYHTNQMQLYLELKLNNRYQLFWTPIKDEN